MKSTGKRTKPHGQRFASVGKRAVPRNRDAVKLILEKAFRGEFPTDTVDVSDGYQNNIHVMVVSRKFDLLSEKDKQDLMWRIIDQTDLSPEEKGLISLAYPISPNEIK